MLFMVLLAAALSGVAAATPGDGSDRASPQAEAAQTEHPPADDGSEGDDHEVPDRQAAADQDHTVADCQGLVEGLDLSQGAEATGLDMAIARVEADCEENLTAPGLLVALEHLIDNRQRHADHEASMADHGRSADHGQSADHGPDAEHGSSGDAPGHSGGAAGDAGS